MGTAGKTLDRHEIEGEPRKWRDGLVRRGKSGYAMLTQDRCIAIDAVGHVIWERNLTPAGTRLKLHLLRGLAGGDLVVGGELRTQHGRGPRGVFASIARITAGGQVVWTHHLDWLARPGSRWQNCVDSGEHLLCVGSQAVENGGAIILGRFGSEQRPEWIKRLADQPRRYMVGLALRARVTEKEKWRRAASRCEVSEPIDQPLATTQAQRPARRSGTAVGNLGAG